MLRRTWEQAVNSGLAERVIIATEDERILQHVQEFGECMMTSTEHQSGTDRCFEVLERCGEKFDILINLQGDEPFIQTSQISLLKEAFQDKDTDIATLKIKIEDLESLHNPNCVKVVCTKDDSALYFSRQSIPFQRGIDQSAWLSTHSYFRHIGMYAFRTAIIQELSQLKESALEQAEKLEQLRWLENGYKIRVKVTDFASPAVDTREDLHAVDNFLKMNPGLFD